MGVGQGNTTSVSNNAGLGCWDGAVYTVIDEDHTFASPVGTFNECVVLALTRSNCVDAGVTHIVFAPDVGIVEYTETTIAGPRTYSLTYAEVNGVVYEEQTSAFTGGLITSVAVEKARFFVTASGSAWTDPETLRIRLTVTNETDAPINYVYRSGQEFDIVVSDDVGNEIYRWSWGRGFILPVIFREFAVGETLTFEMDFPLRENDPNYRQNGPPIPPGNYRVTMDHKGIGLDVEATSVFSIEAR